MIMRERLIKSNRLKMSGQGELSNRLVIMHVYCYRHHLEKSEHMISNRKRTLKLGFASDDLSLNFSPSSRFSG